MPVMALMPRAIMPLIDADGPGGRGNSRALSVVSESGSSYVYPLQRVTS